MMTGDEYRASLSDDRETFFEGEQIEDLPGTWHYASRTRSLMDHVGPAL